MPEKRSHKLDVVAVALLAVVLFLTVALLTYHASDVSSPIPTGQLINAPPAGHSTSVVARLGNACGRSGAYAAELLYRLLGWGAFFFVGSLLVIDVWLLSRRPLNDLVLRACGWLMALLGSTTMLALVGPAISPGPVIGPGGYLGAAGRALLEINFAVTGAFILTISLLLGGLLLCTDYLLLRLVAGVLRVPAKFTLVAAGQMLGRTFTLPRRKQTDLDNVSIGAEAEPAVVIRGKRLEGSASADDEHEDKEKEEVSEDVKVKSSSAAKPVSGKNEEQEDHDADEHSEGEEASQPGASAAPSLGARLASALKIRNLGKNEDRDEVLNQLDAAANHTDEVIDYEFPSLDLLLPGDSVHLEEHEKEVRLKAKMLEKTFLNFGFKVKVVEIETGPVIAQYEVELEAGLRLSKITSLADDLAIALRVPSVRIVAPIPGKNTVGIEVPNNDRQLVRLREVIEETNGRVKKMRIPLYLGKDVAGNPMAVDLATLPHLLIAGRTGTGKSVCLNSIIVSMLMTRSPNDVRMLMIDPKMVELSPYKNLPHLMHPVVTDMRKAEAILAWAVEKMEERYALLARAGVRHISVYNQLGDEELMDRLKPETDEERAAIPHHLPYIVIVADEIADLMMTSAKEVEQHIIRLAQKSRAVGIHLVLATQKPTVDVITGLIKSNLPARICFQVASRTDSRVVLDEMGSEKLLGNGDMLFLLPGTSTMLRGQGTYLSDDEINRVLDCVGTTQPQFVTELVQLKPAAAGDGNDAEKFKNRDELYEQAVDVVIREGRGSVSLLQRALGIGYGRAARLIDYMAEDGIVGQYNGSQAREVLMTLEQWSAIINPGESGGGTQPVAGSTGTSNTVTSPMPAAPAWTSAPTALSVASLPKLKRNRILPDPEPEDDDSPLSHSEHESIHRNADDDEEDTGDVEDTEDEDYNADNEADEDEFDGDTDAELENEVHDKLEDEPASENSTSRANSGSARTSLPGDQRGRFSA
ncbi:MAG TPA: DNA translocase FtsK 4TM domain-containing protein [Pirellulales bacterium]|nr:DNA translocase FtsK 4TM domain-containing protein [Pirellulales bacterium]